MLAQLPVSSRSVRHCAKRGRLVNTPRATMAAVAAKKSVSGRMEELKQAKKIAFIPFIVAGDPDLETTEKALAILDNAGADVIELGVPYSDPLADGQTIHTAATRALQKGIVLEDVINVVRKVSPSIKAPIVMFTYYNPIMRRGLDNFCQTIKAAGAAGLLVPDLPLEETGGIRAACQANGLELVLLATPTTPKERMLDIARASQGFVYLVSVTGVTGERAQVSDRVESLVQMLHDVTDKPGAVGFGVSKPEHAQQIVDWKAEGVICGSALVRALAEAPSQEAGLAALESLAKSLRAAIP